MILIQRINKSLQIGIGFQVGTFLSKIYRALYRGKDIIESQTDTYLGRYLLKYTYIFFNLSIGMSILKQVNISLKQVQSH